MSFEIETVSPVQRRIQFTIPGAEVSKKLDAAFQKIQTRVRIPGFRPGHVPRKILEQRFGQQLRSEVAADIINFEFQRAAPAIDYIGQPEVQQHELPAGGDFRFAITVQVKPAVEVKSWQGMKVAFPEVVVTEAEVDLSVERQLAGHAKLTEVDDGSAIVAGNLVQVEIKDGDVVLEAGTMVNTGKDKYWPGIEGHLVGKKQGDTFTVSLTAPDDSAHTSHRGRPFDATVSVLGVQAMRVPALTDALATSLGYEGGAEAMRAALRFDLENKANEAARNQARVNLLRKLVDENPVDVPAALTEKNLRLLVEELTVQAQYRGRDPRSIRYSDAQMADLRSRAEFAAKAGVLLEAIARAEGIRITDEDLERKYQEIADQRGQRVEAIRGYIQKDGAVNELRRHLLEERTLDYVLERAELETVRAELADAPTTPVEAAPVEAAPAEAAPVEEKKAKKVSKKAKADAAPEAEAAPAVEAAPEAEAAPAEEAKPKKAPRKKKDAAE